MQSWALSNGEWKVTKLRVQLSAHEILISPVQRVDLVFQIQADF